MARNADHEPFLLAGGPFFDLQKQAGSCTTKP